VGGKKVWEDHGAWTRTGDSIAIVSIGISRSIPTKV